MLKFSRPQSVQAEEWLEEVNKKVYEKNKIAINDALVQLFTHSSVTVRHEIVDGEIKITVDKNPLT